MSVNRYSVGVDGIDPNGNLVKYEDYAALEAKCAALAAENAGLKSAHRSAIDVILNPKNKATLYVDSTIIMGVSTQATGAFLAEVRASAIDSLVDIKTKQLADMHPDTHAFGATAMSIRSQINELQMFAAQLRKGVQ